MFKNKYNHELGQHSARILFCGLSGRIADRHFLKIMLQEGKKPIAIIEEYERRQEVQKFLSEHPDWKPVIRYVSFDSRLQDKYPMFTKETFNQFLYQHKIGSCVLSMVDHETDNFVRLNPNTDISKSLSNRAILENQLGNFVAHYISNRHDNPVLFHYLEPERLAELKSNFYYNKNAAKSMNLSRRTLVETTWFMSYMIECLDGRNVKYPILESQIKNAEGANMRPAQSIEAKQAEQPVQETLETTKSSRMRHFLIGEDIKKLQNEIIEAIRSNKDNQNCARIQDAVDQMMQHIPSVKRMHHKTQEKILRYVRSVVGFMQSSIGMTASSGAKRLYAELSYTLNKAILSNGEREHVRAAEKQASIDLQSYKDRKAMVLAAARAESKRTSHAQQRFDDLAAQSRRTPEEVEKANREKQMRREADKARKIAKRNACKQKNMNGSGIQKNIDVAVRPAITMSPVTRSDIMRITVTVGEIIDASRQYYGRISLQSGHTFSTNESVVPAPYPPVRPKRQKVKVHVNKNQHVKTTVRQNLVEFSR